MTEQIIAFHESFDGQKRTFHFRKVRDWFDYSKVGCAISRMHNIKHACDLDKCIVHSASPRQTLRVGILDIAQKKYVKRWKRQDKRRVVEIMESDTKAQERQLTSKTVIIQDADVT